MNQEQIMVAIRQLLQVGGSVAATLGATQGQIDSWTNILTMVIGAGLAIAGAVWTQSRNTNAGIVSKAAGLNEVKGMTVTNENLGRAAKESDPTVRVEVRPQF